MFYGNSDYWYLIANTNGLTSDPTAPLVAGMALDIPARATQENTATSFKPMQLEQIIGDTNPYLPYIPPPPKCNAIAMIVMIAVTVLVSVYLPGAIGMAAGFTSGFVGGVAGSIAGQSVGKALGVVEHFSLKQALVSGVTQGFATGAAETLKAAQWAKDAGLVVKAGKHAGDLAAAGKMLIAANSVGVNWAANRLVGNNSVSFSWRNVVTSAAAAGAMHGIESIGVGNADDTVGSMLRSFSDSNPVTGGTVQNIMSAAVSWNVKRGIYGNHFKDEHWNFKEVARDAFGNAIGNSIAGKLINAEQTRQNAMQASDALAQQVDARLNAGPSADGLLDTLGRIDQEVADSIADDFGGNLYVMTQEQEQLARIAADKTANAIFKYNAMSAQTQKDIAAIEQRSRQSAQARAEQWDIRQARQQQKLVDFRMTNPVYRAPAPAYNWDTLIENAKETRLRMLGSSLYIDRRVTPEEQYFQETGQLDKLYYSRVQKHDPVGNVGLGVWGTLEQNIEMHGVLGGLYWKGVGALTTFNSKMALGAGRSNETVMGTLFDDTSSQSIGNKVLIKGLQVVEILNSDEIDRLNVKMANDVAKSHLQMVIDDFKYDSQGIKGLLSERQITQYHHEVFQSNNASIYFYGGTLGIGNLQGPVPEFIKQGLSMFYLHPAGDL